MQNRYWAFLLLCFTSLTQGAPSYLTFPADVDWATQSSPHFQIIFRQGQTDFAVRSLHAAERAWQELTPIFPPAPEKIYIVLGDFQDSLNGYALTFPYPHIVLFASPPDAGGQLASLDDWLSSVILHELVHILHVYPASGLWGTLRSIFGSVISPNGLMPSHFHEGLAVQLETLKTKGGRGRSAAFASIERMAVEENVWGSDAFFSIDQLDGSPIRPPYGTTPYLFGYYLYDSLWKKKGAEGIKTLIGDYSSNWPFFYNGPLERTYGTTYQELWKEVFEVRKVATQIEIRNIKKEGLSELGYLTDSRHGKWNLVASPSKEKIAYRNSHPYEKGSIQIAQIRPFENLTSIEVDNTADGMCWIAENEILYIESETKNQYQTFKLKSVDLTTKESTDVTLSGETLRHAREVSCGLDGNSLLLYQETGGKGVVKELKRKREEGWHLSREWNIPTGTWVSGLHYTAKGASRLFIRNRSTTEVYYWGNTGTPELQIKMEGHLFNPVAGEETDETLAIAQFDGRNEIWRLDWKRLQATKLVSLLGGTNSFAPWGKGFVLTSYRHNGFDIATTPSFPQRVFRLASLASIREVSETKLSPPELSPVTAYSPWETFTPKTWVPSLLLVPDGIQVGLWIPAFDLSQKHFFQIFGGYDSRGLPFGSVGYSYRFLQAQELNFDIDYSPSYLISTQDFFKRWGGSISWSGKIPGIAPSFSFGPTFRRVEPLRSLPANQSVGAQFGIAYNVGQKTRPNAIAPIAGTTLAASWSQYFQSLGSTHNYFSSLFSVDQYLEVPGIKNHILYAGAKLGVTEGTDLYVNFFQAGGELIFSQGRGTFLNRGFQPGTFVGRRVFNLNLEYRFPIADVYRGYELLPFKLKRVYASVVADTTSIDYGYPTSRPNDLFSIFYTSAGAELRSDWQFGFYLPSHVRLGLYHGFGQYGEALYGVLGFEASI